MSKITLVCSGKGGDGKSTFSSLIGKSLCNNGYKVLLVEINSQSSSLHINLGCENSVIYNMNDILMNNCKPNDAILETKLSKNLYFIPSLNSTRNIDIDSFLKLLNGLKKFFNHIVIDVNDDSVIPRLSEYIDSGIVITTLEPSSIKNACHTINNINEHFIDKYSFVVNNLHLDIFDNNFYKNIDDVIDILGIRLLGVIPTDTKLFNGMFLGSKISGTTVQIYESICSRLIGIYKPLLIK